MSKETKGEKPTDVRPKYEPPTVLRMGDPRKRAGAQCLGDGSGDGGQCAGHGQTAGADCWGNGISATTTCNANGVFF